jgi:RHS repeat-associated protein
VVLYAGYRFDAETGLYHVRHRMYHATLGRWIQRDPAGYVDGANLYEYTRGSPVAFRDSFGLATWKKCCPDYFDAAKAAASHFNDDADALDDLARDLTKALGQLEGHLHHIDDRINELNRPLHLTIAKKAWERSPWGFLSVSTKGIEWAGKSFGYKVVKFVSGTGKAVGKTALKAAGGLAAGVYIGQVWGGTYCNYVELESLATMKSEILTASRRLGDIRTRALGEGQRAAQLAGIVQDEYSYFENKSWHGTQEERDFCDCITANAKRTLELAREKHLAVEQWIGKSRDIMSGILQAVEEFVDLNDRFQDAGWRP